MPVTGEPLEFTELSEDEWSALLDCPPPVLEAEPEELSPSRVVDYLVALQREQSRLAALESRALVAVAGRATRTRSIDVTDDAGRVRQVSLADEVREEIAAALHWSPWTVSRQIEQARMLAGPLVATRTALERGDLTAAHVRVIAATAADASADSCGAWEARVLTRATTMTRSQAGTLARRVLACVDPAGAERRRARSRKEIGVIVYPEIDGLATLLARFPVEQAARVHAALDAHARAATVDCDATLGQRRVQGLIDAVCGTGGAGATGGSPAVSATIHVVVDAATLLGLDDAPGSVGLLDGSREPITVSAVRDLLADPDLPATLRRLGFDPITAELLDQGRRSYQVTSAMRAFLVARDVTCRMPGCTRRADACQIDHARPWGDGGSTDRSNLGPLCARHHQLKTHACWTMLRTQPDGSVRWRSPQGREHVFQPYRGTDPPG